MGWAGGSFTFMIKHTCSFSNNYIDGSEFVKLSEAEVKQMVQLA